MSEGGSKTAGLRLKSTAVTIAEIATQFEKALKVCGALRQEDASQRLKTRSGRFREEPP